MENFVNVFVQCCYFKESGKFYSNGDAVIPVPDDLIYPKEIGKYLPGIQGGVWSEAFTIRVNDQYAELVFKE
jgi:hypothetical protein